MSTPYTPPSAGSQRSGGPPSGQADAYDPYIPAGQQKPESQGRAQALQAQINDTVVIMRDNIDKFSQRGENLERLQDKTDNLAGSAQQFHRGANKVRKQMWWKDMKMRACLIVGIILLIVIIVVPVAVTSNK